ncbi:uncharacterized protein RAG0_09997 [Rhynchosporium agropyri]|uniref:Uncharacterized protein n=1 Tax=Rhynchosporium agropyri TaxID=914238 RepID=A0A1E1KY11_9HELO|nr:uncharacterized protein RAG0_09997 [Rhynchosporium agropyri]
MAQEPTTPSPRARQPLACSTPSPRPLRSPTLFMTLQRGEAATIPRRPTVPQHAIYIDLVADDEEEVVTTKKQKRGITTSIEANFKTSFKEHASLPHSLERIKPLNSSPVEEYSSPPLLPENFLIKEYTIPLGLPEKIDSFILGPDEENSIIPPMPINLNAASPDYSPKPARMVAEIRRSTEDSTKASCKARNTAKSTKTDGITKSIESEDSFSWTSKSRRERSSTGLEHTDSRCLAASKGSVDKWQDTRGYKRDECPELYQPKPSHSSLEQGMGFHEQDFDHNPFRSVTEKPTFLIRRFCLVPLSIPRARAPTITSPTILGKPVTPNSLLDLNVHFFGLFINASLDPRQSPIHAETCQLRSRRPRDSKKTGWCHPSKGFTYVCENTKEGDLLRQYILDLCNRMPWGLDQLNSDHMPEELLHDIFTASLCEQIKVKVEDGDMEMDMRRYYLDVEN